MAKASALSTKILVTNRGALRRKYKTAGVRVIEKAVGSLAKADRRRGLATRLIYLDAAGLGRARVTDPADPAQNKRAVDAVVKKHRPEYLVILGSHDVVPYQVLKNKLHDPADPDSDPDPFALGDLPYACESAYSQQVTKFLGPTRVVGRLPDITGASNPAYLLSLLKASSSAKGLERPGSAFALSAQVWLRSTRMSVRNVLGTAPAVLASPGRGPRFRAALLREKVHFVNCHGDRDDHTFEGEGPGNRISKALDARRLVGLSAGTVAAFECCYGAQLYDPRGLPSMGIANRYLAKRAAGVLASTTISYGPRSSNAYADVICQLVIGHVLRGASLGRALLEARLAYVRAQSVVDPYDEKTLAQFVLLGDPSIHPFPEAVAPKAVEQAERLQRRVRLMKAGVRLADDASYTVPCRAGAGASSTCKELQATMRHFKKVRTFEVREPATDRKVLGQAKSGMPRARRVYVATRRRHPARPSDKSPRLEALLAYEVRDRIVEIRLVSR